LKYFQMRAYPNISRRALSENSTDNGHLSKVSAKMYCNIAHAGPT